MKPWTITLPYPPSVNTYWRQFQGRTLLSKKGREYKQAVAVACLRNGLPRRLIGRIAMDIFATMPDRRRRDIDNITKCLIDSLAAAGVFADDEQIDDLHIRRGPVSKPGSVVVTVWEIVGAENVSGKPRT